MRSCAGPCEATSSSRVRTRFLRLLSSPQYRRSRPACRPCGENAPARAGSCCPAIVMLRIVNVERGGEYLVEHGSAGSAARVNLVVILFGDVRQRIPHQSDRLRAEIFSRRRFPLQDPRLLLAHRTRQPSRSARSQSAVRCLHHPRKAKPGQLHVQCVRFHFKL